MNSCSKADNKNDTENSSVVSESEEASYNVPSTDTTESDSTTANYAVTVLDALGAPVTSGVVVKFLKGETQVAMQIVDEKGVAIKELEKGDYTVDIGFTSSGIFGFDAADLQLSAEKHALTVVLYQILGDETMSITAGNNKHNAHYVNAGATKVELSEDRTYYLFAPTQSGTYEFTTSDKNAVIGYYGMPSFVQEQSAAEVVDNTFTISVSESMIGTSESGTTIIVIGIDSTEDLSNCLLKITRTGDAKLTIADFPWEIYEATTDIAQYTLPQGATLKYFDLKADSDSYNLVFNEDDGCYHLNSTDGPLVLVCLAEDPEVFVCFKTILDSSGINRYFFDDNGEFVKKVSYSECLLEYIACADKDKGLYPLTADLEHIIKQRGEYVGWWDKDSNGYIFFDAAGAPDTSINSDIAWLFMCCYIAE